MLVVLDGAANPLPPPPRSSRAIHFVESSSNYFCRMLHDAQGVVDTCAHTSGGVAEVSPFNKYFDSSTTPSALAAFPLSGDCSSELRKYATPILFFLEGGASRRGLFSRCVARVFYDD